MNVRRHMRRILTHLPRPIRHQVFRSQASFPLELPEELTIRLARTREELETAFGLLHDSYVESGFMTPHPSGMRVTPYHSLPSTSTIIALWRNEIVGTVSIIRDNPLGLPMQAIFDLTTLRVKPNRIAEISSLAIRPDFRHRPADILFPLFKYIMNYCTGYFGISHMVICINPRHADLYDSLIFFEPLQARTVDHYDFVNGAPALGRFLDLRRHYARSLRGFSRDRRRDGNWFFCHANYSQLRFPHRRNFTLTDPVMTPKTLDYFFRERTDLYESMPPRTRAILSALYRTEESPDLLPTRRHRRHEVDCPATVSYPHKAKPRDASVRDASAGGFRLYFPSGIRINEPLDVVVQISNTERVELRAVPVWSDSEGTYGFSILSSSTQWMNFIQDLERSLDLAG